MNEFCKELVAKMDSLLKDPANHSVAYFAERVYAEGFAAGLELERKRLRLVLGLHVPGDVE